MLQGVIQKWHKPYHLLHSLPALKPLGTTKAYSATPYHHHPRWTLWLEQFICWASLGKAFAFPFQNYTCKANPSLESAWNSTCYAPRDHISQTWGTWPFSLSSSLTERFKFSPKLDVYLFTIRTSTSSLDRKLPFIEHFLCNWHDNKSRHCLLHLILKATLQGDSPYSHFTDEVIK